MSQTRVTVIPPRVNLQLVPFSTGYVKKRVAAYARVSTDTEEQLSSYEAQVDHYTCHIQTNDEWEFVKVYTDEGISATSTAKRDGFKQMVQDALDGKIDLIITKSVSRFARNTVDSLTTVRQLKEKGVEVYFEKEDINTLTALSEFLLTVWSAFAQNESYSKSNDIKWGLDRTFQNPGSKYYQRTCYGYMHDKNGKLIIDEEKAAVVRMIYRLYAEGNSLAKISARLNEMKIPSPRGHSIWARETIRKILRNEKYTGSVVLQKTYVEDYLTHKQKRNDGQKNKFMIGDNHEAIIQDDYQ
ncbi:MAG: recombinase family protein [Christensenellales bacterium]|jgi:site-specific DNA recombinase